MKLRNLTCENFLQIGLHKFCYFHNLGKIKSISKFVNKDEKLKWIQKEIVNKRIQKHRRWRRKNDFLYRKKDNERSVKYRKKYPEKTIARQKLRYAVRVGKIKRLPCEVCSKPNGQGHHPDYSKPLEVIWLCAPCHAAEHKKLSTAKLVQKSNKNDTTSLYSPLCARKQSQ